MAGSAYHLLSAQADQVNPGPSPTIAHHFRLYLLVDPKTLPSIDIFPSCLRATLALGGIFMRALLLLYVAIAFLAADRWYEIRIVINRAGSRVEMKIRSMGANDAPGERADARELVNQVIGGWKWLSRQ
jgi:hypothetical protein